MKFFRVIVCVSVAGLVLAGSVFGQEFVNGNYFFNNHAEKVIDEYDVNGNMVGSIIPDLNGAAMRGITFGPDGMLYAVVPSNGFATVVSMDHLGRIHDRYNFTSFTGSNVSYGKIEFGSDDTFYVSSGLGVVKFTMGNLNSGHRIYNSNAFDLDILPNGNLLVANDSRIEVIDQNGGLLRNINLSDPYQTHQGFVGFSSLRGIEYDPSTNVIYATQLGYTGFNFRLMKLEADTGFLLDHEYFWYGDQLFLDSGKNLIVGSWAQPTGQFDTNLGFIRSIGEVGLFVTQFNSQVIPEPGAIGLLMVAMAYTLASRRSRYFCR